MDVLPSSVSLSKMKSLNVNKNHLPEIEITGNEGYDYSIEFLNGAFWLALGTYTLTYL